MRQHKQAYRHDPAAGIHGDCDRTSIACLLELPRDSVPHFFADGATPEQAHALRHAWLQERGLVEFQVHYDGALPLSDLLAVMEHNNPGTEWILQGASKNGTNHCVVCCGGEIVWDPALDDSGIVGPCDDGYWWATVMAVTRPKVVP